MPINLKEHAVFIERLQMDMVPLSIAEKAVEESFKDVETKVEEAMNLIQKSLADLGTNLPELDD